MTIKKWIRNFFTWITCTAFGIAFILIVILFGSLFLSMIGGGWGMSMLEMNKELKRLQASNAKTRADNVAFKEMMSDKMYYFMKNHRHSM